MRRTVKTQDAVEDFHLLENSHKGFQQAMKARRICFISFIILINIFRLNKDKDDIQRAYVYFFHETANSHNLETITYITAAWLA